MAVDGRSDFHRNGCGNAAVNGIPGVFGGLLLVLWTRRRLSVLQTGVEIAFAIPTITDQRRLRRMFDFPARFAG